MLASSAADSLHRPSQARHTRALGAAPRPLPRGGRAGQGRAPVRNARQPREVHICGQWHLPCVHPQHRLSPCRVRAVHPARRASAQQAAGRQRRRRDCTRSCRQPTHASLAVRRRTGSRGQIFQGGTAPRRECRSGWSRPPPRSCAPPAAPHRAPAVSAPAGHHFKSNFKISSGLCSIINACAEHSRSASGAGARRRLGVKPVHAREQLVERLLHLVVGIAPAPPLLANLPPPRARVGARRVRTAARAQPPARYRGAGSGPRPARR